MSSSKNPTSSSSKLPYIPPEIWIQIFPKLPAKTLLRFRCVCKSWHSIIDNPDFVHMHFQNSQINSENNTSNKLLVALEGMGCTGNVGCVLTVRDAQTLGKTDHILRTHSYKYRLIGSCNGLPFTCEESGTLRFLFFLIGSLAVFSISEVTSSIWMLDLDNQKRPWTLWFSGKSTQDGYEAFELCSANLEKARLGSLTQEKEAKDRLTKVFYCESDGGYFVCGNKTYNIASGQVQPFKRYMSSHLKLEKYWENLVLFKGYGARDLRSFP